MLTQINELLQFILAMFLKKRKEIKDAVNSSSINSDNMTDICYKKK